MNASSQDEYIRTLEELFHGLEQMRRRTLRGSDLTPLQHLILRRLWLEGPVSPTFLARFLGVRAQTVTSIADSLERKGWVRRRPSPDDRRGSVIDLTPRSRRRIRAMRGVQFDRLRVGLTHLSESELHAATSALRATLQAFPLPDPSCATPVDAGKSGHLTSRGRRRRTQPSGKQK
ncbi:MAG: MarR family transcriptional regulator [Thermoplasmata archaeon]|nr:MarR family transcriptional regulator [Thermoplasmata archaeon]